MFILFFTFLFFNFFILTSFAILKSVVDSYNFDLFMFYFVFDFVCFFLSFFLLVFGRRFSLQERALLLFLRYASRWGNQTMRGFIKVGVTEPARHCAPYICPCQFIEEHLKCKPQGKLKYLKCSYWCTASEYYD